MDLASCRDTDRQKIGPGISALDKDNVWTGRGETSGPTERPDSRALTMRAQNNPTGHPPEGGPRRTADPILVAARAACKPESSRKGSRYTRQRTHKAPAGPVGTARDLSCIYMWAAQNRLYGAASTSMLYGDRGPGKGVQAVLAGRRRSRVAWGEGDGEHRAARGVRI